jgi:UDP-N-acetylmuramoyl-tripeptide--D-alanyl-D-alanine ligase
MPVYLVYMLQQVEYDPRTFLKWFARLPRLDRVMHRQQLGWSGRAKLLVGFCYGVALVYVAAILLASVFLDILFLCALILTPGIIIGLLCVVVSIAWLLIEQPRRARLLAQSEKLFTRHPGIKIAIAGSYGKTSMKELLVAALKTDKKIAATPGNENVPISHARWIHSLDGDEDLLLIEYGESAPGDVKRFAETTHPDIGIITGLAPNHLDRYLSLEAVAKDLFSLADYLEDKKVYVNAEPAAIKPYLKAVYNTYDRNSACGWMISDISVSIEGTSFSMQKGSKHMRIKSALLGRHQVGPLAFVAAFSHSLGLSVGQIEANLGQMKPYEHRMQSRQLAGAWVIDDAYNGNLEGIRAGLKLLKELPAKRKMYVTPGLVDQGEETEKVHHEIGELIADAQPDKVVLMQNSVTRFITQGLNNAGFKREITLERDPLQFYTNLEQIVAAGDLIMLQNDWTDNYH